MKTRVVVPGLALVMLVAGAVLGVFARHDLAHALWMCGTIVLGAPVVWHTIMAARRGRFATDIVATLSIVGAVLLAQPLAGLVIVLMQTGGEALERFAEGRASAAVRALEAAAPRVAHRAEGDRVVDIVVADIAIGDTLLVRPGEMVPCDGVVTDGNSELDTAAVTGEPMPRPAAPGTVVLSGMVNQLGALRLRAAAPAGESQYARIVELVRSAQASKAPFQRTADKYAVWFTPITLAACAIAVAVTHDWSRALAVLVVATPCPLILAVPVAIVGGINRAARRRIIVRNGGALETLSKVNVAVFDKTGTITLGKPRLRGVRVATGFTRACVLRRVGAVEQGSSHLLGRVLVEAAEAEGIAVPQGSEHLEAPGQGVFGIVDGLSVRVGSRAFVLPHCADGGSAVAILDPPSSELRTYVEIGGELAAVIEYADEVRPELPGVLLALRAQRVRRVVLLSGDHSAVVQQVATRAGIVEAHGDLSPAAKAALVSTMRAVGNTVMMVGDGINDAPALAGADVGVALAGHGGGITAEAADVIILTDSLDRVTDALVIGQRTMRIARQSIRVGLGLSALAMVVAAFGGLPPAVGAGLQEVIDVTVILNALRAAGGRDG